ncbi:MAG: immune inhibitor A [Gemmatimonadota bacterium]|nr:immune inhibitor A [Gemmatimonadota bacterium]
MRPGGGPIRIDDYFVVPAMACPDLEEGSRSLNEIGIFTHEVGHVFGLPDLYDVRSTSAHAGVGTWDLMASGAWGCDNDSPESPCHMGAWSKAMLGWVDVVELDDGVDHGMRTLGPVQDGGEVYRVRAQDGSGEYFLLENRTPVGFDSQLHGGGGLLVWQVDPVRVSNRWGANTVNGSDMPGVRLRQADGRDDLGRVVGDRGDAGDPFPGVTGNTVFHAGSTPAATSYDGTPTGLTVLEIEPTGSNVGFHVLTRFSAVTLVADGSDGTTNLFTVDGAAPRASGESFTAAPFSTRIVEAAAGEPLEPGVRRPFDSWLDEVADRVRSVEIPLEDTTLTAIYDDDAKEVRLEVTLDGGEDGIVPAVVESFPTSPDLWFRERRDVSVEVKPRAGFSFTEWTGALEGEANPAFITMDAPVTAGAILETIYEVPSMSFTPVAARDAPIELSVLNATDPVRWSLVDGKLPEGLSLRSGGVVSGAALETGTFIVTVRARDAIGLTAEGEVTLEVHTPDIPGARAASPFLGTDASVSEAEKRFLDRRGNGNGRYDLGDLRAWVAGDEEATGSAEPVSRAEVGTRQGAATVKVTTRLFETLLLAHRLPSWRWRAAMRDRVARGRWSPRWMPATPWVR